MGKVAGKLFLKSGNEGEIIDLPQMSIYKMNHKKKEFEVVAIEKITPPDMSEMGEESYPEEKEVEEEKPKEKSEIEIIRSEFKVTETGQTKTINNFPSKEYNVLWLTEWQNNKTGEKGIDSLSTIVWTTPITDHLKEAQKEEMTFSKAYMAKIGINIDEVQQQILGTHWLSLFNKMKEEEKTPQQRSYDKFVDEMNKIEGYPVIIDGKYYAIRPQLKPQEEEKEEETDITNVKKMFGGFAKKALKKKSRKPKTLEPAFAYYTELIEYTPTDINETDLQVPGNYKQK
jgi:hypothetical protein